MSPLNTASVNPTTNSMDGYAKSPRYATISSTSNASNVKNSMVEVINVLAAVPMTLISGGRNRLIQLGVAALTYWALFRRQNNRWKGMRLGFRTVLKFVAIALVGLASFKPLLSLMGRKAGDSTMYEYLGERGPGGSQCHVSPLRGFDRQRRRHGVREIRV